MAAPAYLPVFLDLRARPVVVVGGGPPAARRARDLLAGAARVTVVSPTLGAELEALAEAGGLAWRPRAFAPPDVRGAALVIAATGRADVDDAVARAARAARVPVSVVDDASRSDLVFGAVVRRGDLQISVSTGGRSPGLARLVREQLEALFGPEWAELVARAGDERMRARAAAATPAERLDAGLAVARRALESAPWRIAAARRMAQDTPPQ